MKKIISVMLIIALVFSFAGCTTEKKTTKDIIGTWTDVKSGEDKIVFNEDNTGSVTSDGFGSIPLNWEAGAGTVTITTVLSDKSINLNVIKEDGIVKIVSEDEKVVYVSEENYEAERKKALEEMKANAATIEVNKTYEDDEYADIKFVKIMSTEKITSSMGNSVVYSSDDGSVYIDVIMDYTNNTSSAISCEEVIEFMAIMDDGTVYKADDFFVETDNGTSITSYQDIAPLSTVRLHCACSVPKGEGKYSLFLDANGKTYSYNYTLNEVVNNAKSIKFSDVVEKEDVAKLVFKSVKITDDLLPPNTSGYYRHYPVDNASNTYLVAIFDITNNYTTARDCEEFVNVTATFMDKYTYTGFVVVEDTDGKGFSSYEDISPLSTRRFYYLIEIPKTVADGDYELTITFAGEEYSYKG